MSAVGEGMALTLLYFAEPDLFAELGTMSLPFCPSSSPACTQWIFNIPLLHQLLKNRRNLIPLFEVAAQRGLIVSSSIDC